MKINRMAIKHNAKLIISRTKPSPVLAALIYVGITTVLNWLTMMINGDFYVLKQTLPALEAQMEAAISGASLDYSAFDALYQQASLTPISSILLLALSIMHLMMGVGIIIFCFNAAHFKLPAFGNLFDGFAIFGKVLWLNILQWFFSYLWSLAGIIPGAIIIMLLYPSLGNSSALLSILLVLLPFMFLPGIMASYRYRMSFYIMLDNPKMSALSCINLSKLMMLGRKWELFVLDLSFVGWQLLTLVPFVAIWVTPYQIITNINFYIALRDLSAFQSGANPNFGGDGTC